MMTLEQALALRGDRADELSRRALVERESFVFSLQRRSPEEESRWGGDVKLCINRNVVLHFVPGFNADMERLDELPQFCVFPSDDLSGDDERHPLGGSGELDSFEGVVFYVEEDAYHAMVAELRELAGDFEDRILLPDRMFAESPFVKLVADRVLPHPIVEAEKPYDFTRLRF